jgi:hypothetical protein
MILVCAAGLVGSTADDVAKEVAIYRAHKAAPSSLPAKGETRFSAASRSHHCSPRSPAPGVRVVNRRRSSVRLRGGAGNRRASASAARECEQPSSARRQREHRIGRRSVSRSPPLFRAPRGSSSMGCGPAPTTAISMPVPRYVSRLCCATRWG